MTKTTITVPTLDLILAVEAECVAQMDILRGHMERGNLMANVPATMWEGCAATAANAIRRSTHMMALVARYSRNLPEAETCELTYSIDGDGEIGWNFWVNDDAQRLHQETRSALPTAATQRIVASLVTGTVATPDHVDRLMTAHVALCLAAGAAHAKLGAVA